MQSKFKRFKFHLLLWTALIVCRLLRLTWRIHFINGHYRQQAESQSPSGAIIIASFHENAVAGILTHIKQNIACLTSHSKDGEIVAFLCKKLGLKTVRGSSSKGGKEAREEIVDALNAGTSIAFTVDGPRGPRRISKPGVIDVAKKSGALIVPITSYAKSCWILHKAWDRTRIPKPFSRVLVYYGEPIKVHSQIDRDEFEQARLKLDGMLEQNDGLVLSTFEALWHRAEKKPPSRQGSLFM